VEWDEDTGSQVLNDYVEKYPAGENKKSGKARGSVALSQYVNSKGSRSSNAQLSRGPMWDWELFSVRIKQCRPWDSNRIQREWDLLKSTPKIESAPGPNGAPRYRIPAWMIGEDDWAESRTENFEERRMDTVNAKPKTFNDEEMKEAVEDCKHGFGQLGEASKSDARLPVAASSVTADSSQQLDVGALLLKHVPTDGTEASSPSPAKQAQAAGLDDEPGRKKQKLMDVGVQRTHIASKETEKNKKAITTMWVAMVKVRAELERFPARATPDGGADDAADVSDHNNAMNLAMERLEAALLFFGKKLNIVEGKKDLSIADVVLHLLGASGSSGQ